MYTCIRCDRDMGNTQALIRHKSRKYQCTPNNIVPRDESGDMFRSAIPKVYSCKVCGRDYKYKSMKCVHQKTCNGPAYVAPAKNTATATATAPAPAPVQDTSSTSAAEPTPDMTRLLEFVKNNAPAEIQESLEALEKMLGTTNIASNVESDAQVAININNTGDHNVITNNVIVCNFGSEVIDIPDAMLDDSLTNLDAVSLTNVIRHIFFNKDQSHNMNVRPGSRAMNTLTYQVMDNYIWKDIDKNIVLAAMIKLAANLTYKRYIDTVCKLGNYSDTVDKWHQHMLAHDHLLFFETRRLLKAIIVAFFEMV